MSNGKDLQTKFGSVACLYSMYSLQA